MICGVYTIVNEVAGKQYVGSSIDIERRWAEHIRELENGVHENAYLQRAWNKYGAMAFVFKIVECCESESLLACEQAWLDSLRLGIGLYNISPTAGNCLGVKHTDETRMKMSQAKKGKPSSFLGCKHTDESNEKNRLAHLGKKLSKEHKRKIGSAHRGMKRSKETCEKLRQAQLGKRHDEVAKAKMRKAKLGKSWSLVDGVRVWSQSCQH